MVLCPVRHGAVRRMTLPKLTTAQAFADPPSARRQRAMWLSLALWTALLGLLAAWVGANRVQNYRDTVLGGAMARVNGVKTTLSIAFGQWAALPLHLARKPEVQAFLATPGPDLSGRPAQGQAALARADQNRPAALAMSELLGAFGRDFGLSYLALIDTTGSPVAGANNFGSPATRQAVDINTRAYFQQALSGGKGLQFLVGPVSGVPGLYFASRVEAAGQVVGVAVIKQEGDVVDRLLEDADGDIVLISDANAVVVLGNRANLLLRRLPDAPQRSAEQLQAVYRRLPEPLAWRLAPLEGGAPRGQFAEIDGMPYAVQSAALPAGGLTAWVLAPLSLEAAVYRGVGAVIGGIWLFGCVLIALGWRRLQWLEQALLARQQADERGQAQRASEERFTAVFEHAAEGYVFFQARLGISLCNSGAAALFGADTADQLTGAVIWLPPLSPERQANGRLSRELAAELRDRHVKTGARVQPFEWRFARFDGTEFDAEVAVTALDWASASGPQFCAVIQDITARKQTQAAMAQAQAAAEAASRTKSSFLANMSHELRTPMNAIIGMTHLAIEDGLPEQQRGYVEKAHAAARSLLQILDDILDVSKIEAGQLQLERVDFAVETVINQMADILGLKADQKGLELLFTAAPDLPQRLVGDPTRLRQVLVNLGSNAIKFTDAGEVTVGMEIRAQTEQELELHLWVRDTGPGLRADEQQRLFQPFVQADSSTTRRFGGTGLGLVISRELVERMGGHLWLDSRPGEGATFHFTARFGRSSQSGPVPAQALIDLRGRRALLVDDNAAALEVLGGMLQALGVGVDRAGGAAQALSLFDQAGPGAYGWVLIDWKMPGMDGVACARELLQRRPLHPNTAQPCILLVTAFGRDEALRASTGLPLAGILQKPVTPSSLYEGLLQASRFDGSAWVPARVPMPAPMHAPVPLVAAADARRRLAGARVLLVEDHPINQELARELLQRAGMQVVVAEDGEQALARLADDGPFDGVLMDCQMPVMDGYTATQRLREQAQWRTLPVIAMTASALAEDRARALASGMNAHISKPIDVELMLRTMAQWISVPARAAAVADAAAPEAPAWPPPGASRVIDVADGLARCMGSAPLYRRLLQGFQQTKATVAVELQAARDEGRFDDIKCSLHDLRGLAGTIGARGLQASSEELHQLLLRGAGQHSPAAGFDAALARVLGDLAEVMRDIETLLRLA